MKKICHFTELICVSKSVNLTNLTAYSKSYLSIRKIYLINFYQFIFHHNYIRSMRVKIICKYINTLKVNCHIHY